MDVAILRHHVYTVALNKQTALQNVFRHYVVLLNKTLTQWWTSNNNILFTKLLSKYNSLIYLCKEISLLDWLLSAVSDDNIFVLCRPP